MEFEFDPNKSASNKMKHGIDFEEAQGLWDDMTVRLEARIVSGEPRSAHIGMLRGKHWTAITTERGDSTRIISVRRSRKDEEAFYEQRKASDR